MEDLNALERAIFNWFGRQPVWVVVVAPMAAFVGLDLAGVAVVSLVARHWPWPHDAYSAWLVTAGFIAMSLSYMLTFLAFWAQMVRSRRFRLIQLYQTTWDIRQMAWQEFEDLVAACYQLRGCDVEHVGRDGPDGGIDLKLRWKGKTWLVQCKHYRDSWVGEKPLREFLGVATGAKADGGIFVTSGVFDEKAEAFARRSGRLELVDGDQLLELISLVSGTKADPITCPKCGATMVVKDGRRGRFLGCRRYPECSGSRDLPRPAGAAAVGPITR